MREKPVLSVNRGDFDVFSSAGASCCTDGGKGRLHAEFRPHRWVWDPKPKIPNFGIINAIFTNFSAFMGVSRLVDN